MSTDSRSRVWGWGVGLVLLAGCGGPVAEKPDRQFTDEELHARFPYDLGPDRVDVAAYPKAQQENYLLFLNLCSQCHTPARPLNAPIVAREDWERFARRMHRKSKGTLLDARQAERVIDFLTYDAQRRKVNRREEFLSLQRELNARYKEMLDERARVQLEEGLKLAKDRGYTSP